jgi:ATP adenylyltransferase
MNYEELVQFLEKRMSMSHIYQPVMLMTLLKGKGACTSKKIAKAILEHDESQIEYYTQITHNMVGRVLREHGIVERDGDTYRLRGFDELDQKQIDNLISLCEKRLDQYLKKYGKAVWQHRRLSAGYISGTLRYEIFKQAGFHCNLCGVSADVRALEVDHIIPRNIGGSDDPSNLQALCYRCNAMKQDRDKTDFLRIRESYVHREPGCLAASIRAESCSKTNSHMR